MDSGRPKACVFRNGEPLHERITGIETPHQRRIFYPRIKVKYRSKVEAGLGNQRETCPVRAQ